MQMRSARVLSRLHCFMACFLGVFQFHTPSQLASLLGCEVKTPTRRLMVVGKSFVSVGWEFVRGLSLENSMV